VRRWIWLSAAAGLLAAYGLSRAADPSVLWHIVNDRCVPHEEASHDPSPCSEVDLSQGRARGYVVLKDIVGVAQFLLMPTARISGIESPELLAPEVPNYWNHAWQARTFTEERLHRELPREALSLAVNSRVGRSQNQLHIHIDCVRMDVKAALAAHLTEVGRQWTPFPVQLSGHAYRAMRVDGDSLGDNDPFRLLADGDPQAAADMGNHTLVVVGATFPDRVPGFVILDDRADLAAGNDASGEELQDHTCAVAKDE
jgi:CDP-diacylglycerol pyrophosphatase